MLVIWLSLFVAGASAFMYLHGRPDFQQILPPDYWWNMFNTGIGSSFSKLFSMVVGVICTQTYIQCFFSASSPKVASLGAFAAAAIVIPVGLPSVAIGMYMHVLEPDVVPVLVLPIYLLEHQGGRDCSGRYYAKPYWLHRRLVPWYRHYADQRYYWSQH